MVAFETVLPGAQPGLGTCASTLTPPVSKKAAKLARQAVGAFRAARRERFMRRGQSSRWLVADAKEEHGETEFVQHVARPGTCGWAAGAAVSVRKPEGGAARFAGVQTCASVWSCPCCGYLIRSKRSEEVQDASAWWEKQGGQFLFLTLTVRHYAEDPLERTMNAVTDAFTGMINGAPWKRFSRRHGIRHFIKAQEVTLGFENGWHAHLHVLLFVDLDGAARDLAEDAAQAWAAVEASRGVESARVTGVRRAAAQRRTDDAVEAERIARQGIGEARERELRGWLSDRWGEMVVRNGGREPSKRRGVNIRTVRDGNVIALYVSKLQEGDKPGWGVGNEMSRQDLKKGRLDSLVPLELLDVDGLTDEQIERNRAYWLEFVASTKGRRSMTWSRGLKEAAGIDEVEDDEIAADDDADDADDLVITIRAEHWRGIRDDGDVLARILELVEQGRYSDVALLVPFDFVKSDT